MMKLARCGAGPAAWPLLIGMALTLPATAATPDLPGWAGGKPDTVMRADRCGLYDWFLAEADRQTDGRAGDDALARERVINLANKLADHHPMARSPEYRGRVNYLVFGARGPAHFAFRLSAERLESLLAQDCAG